MTVWHGSESDVVNMVAAVSPVEIVHSEGALRHGYTLAYPQSSCCCWCDCVGGACVYFCMCVSVCVCVCINIISWGSKVSRINHLPISLPTHFDLLLLHESTVTVKVPEPHWTD